MTTIEQAKALLTSIESDDVARSAALANVQRLSAEVEELKAQLGQQRPEPPAVIVLPAPSSLNATATGNIVKVAWSDNSLGEDAFVIEQRDTHGGRDWTIRKTVAPNTTSVDLVMPNADWRYDFRVRATKQNPANPSQELTSEPAEILNVFVRRTAPPPPSPGPDKPGLVRPTSEAEVQAAIDFATANKRPLLLADLDTRGLRLIFRNATQVEWRGGKAGGVIGGGWHHAHAAMIYGGLSNALIEGVAFERTSDAAIAGGYGNSRGLVIRHCSFDEMNEGIHLVGGGPETDVLIEYCLFDRLTRMAIELQNGGRRYYVRFCLGRDWRQINRDSFFVSMAANETTETLVEDCAAWMPDYPVMGDPSNRLGIGVELGGRQAIARRIRIVGPFVPATALSTHNDAIKSNCLFEDLQAYRPNRPWGKDGLHSSGVIYNDGGSRITTVNVREVQAPPAIEDLVQELRRRGLPA
jgi:chitodextrinase